MNFLTFIKKIIKNIIYFFLNRENKKIKLLTNKLLTNQLHLLDIGAAGDISNRWTQIKENIMISLVEPHRKSAMVLKEKGCTVIEKFFYNKKNLNLIFYETKKSMCSGIFKPDFNYLNKYPKPERFEILKEIQISTTTIDDEFKLDNIPHFVKIDTEGSELEILKGATKSLQHILGLEVECEFFKLREKQPLFSEIQKFLENYDFEFIDFLRTVRWERNEHRYTGQPQISDVLFLRKPDLLLKQFKNGHVKEEILLKYIVILVIYNRPDIIKHLIDNLNSEIVFKFELKNIFNLIEKKVTKINKIRRYASFVENFVNNLVSIK